MGTDTPCVTIDACQTFGNMPANPPGFALLPKQRPTVLASTPGARRIPGQILYGRVDTQDIDLQHHTPSSTSTPADLSNTNTNPCTHTGKRPLDISVHTCLHNCCLHAAPPNTMMPHTRRMPTTPDHNHTAQTSCYTQLSATRTAHIKMFFPGPNVLAEVSNV